MRLNRRNVLVGLGTIVAGGGAALGTGAFSTVEAERQVDLNVVGDGSAVVNISVNDDVSANLSESSGDQIVIQVTEAYQDAEITFEDALTFDNTSDDTPYTVELKSNKFISKFIVDDGESENPSFDLEPDDNAEGGEDSKDVGIIVDTGTKNESAVDDLTITIKPATNE